MNNFAMGRKVRAEYLKCVESFPLIPIQSEEHFDAAVELMEELSARELSQGESLYFRTLCQLVGAYDDEHHAIEPASDAEMLQHLLEAKQVSQADLHRGTGIPRSTISEVLAGKRRFSRQMIRKLADFFRVDVSILASNF